jgi:hypothetical protein
MRRQVVEIECGRCDRIERQDLVGVDLAAPGSTSFTAVLLVSGERVMDLHFDELCKPCTKTVRNHLEAVSKEIKKASPNRAADSKELLLGIAPHAHLDPGAKKKVQGAP